MSPLLIALIAVVIADLTLCAALWSTHRRPPSGVSEAAERAARKALQDALDQVRRDVREELHL